MRVVVFVKASKDSEAGVMPSEQLLTEMGKFNEELVKAGIMLAGEGLHPSSKGARIGSPASKRTVVDGPFAETKELVAGFWIWQVRSMDEAIEWVKRCPNPIGQRSRRSRSARSSKPRTSAPSSRRSCASRKRASAPRSKSRRSSATITLDHGQKTRRIRSNPWYLRICGSVLPCIRGFRFSPRDRGGLAHRIAASHRGGDADRARCRPAPKTWRTTRWWRRSNSGRRRACPDNPGAWLTAAAKRRAIDAWRRDRMLDRKHEEIGHDMAAREAADPRSRRHAG